MSLLNYNAREIHLKLVYYGPPGSGKTTNIQWIYRHTTDQNPDMLQLPLQASPSVFFDFLPLDIGEVRGFKTRLHLYTIPTRTSPPPSSEKLLLKGVDGVVFVADSQASRQEDNQNSLNRLTELLKQEGMDIRKIPMVLQYNKRDLSDIESVTVLRTRLNLYNYPDFSCSAVKGAGVFETLKALSKMVIAVLKGLKPA